MRFDEAANFLLDLRRFRIRPGTDATAALLAEVGDPHREVPVVQVAGSNGKGSVARMVECALREAGLTVGLYTSPHFEEFRERVRVDGRPVPKTAVTAFVEAVREYVDGRAAAGEAPTFFEAATALAYWEFARADVDVAVVEVGIGGRHDATSVADPVASAVTTVSLEHTAILGDTVEEIARDKAAVAPRDGPLVTAAEGAALDAVRDAAGRVVRVGEDEAADVTARYGGVRGRVEAAVSLSSREWTVETRVPLPGRHQALNAGVAAELARQAGDAVGHAVSDGDLAVGLRRARWPGRFEVVGDDPLVVLDGAHNPAACERVTETLSEYEYDDCHLVVGAMHDKDHEAMAAALPAAASVTATRPAADRAESAAVLARVFADRAAEVETVPAVEDAVDAALERADPEDAVLVAGSLYAVAAARQRWTGVTGEKRVPDQAAADRALARADVPPEEAGQTDLAHHVVRTRVSPEQARALKETTLAAGGDCALSGVEGDTETVEAVLGATGETLADLCARLRERAGLAAVADRVEAALDGPTPDSDLPWADGTAVMGILNVTPDSFHDGGRYEALDDATERAAALVAAGADIVDVGGESTNPDAEPITAETERDRVVPVIERLAADLDVPISVDTRKAEVARAALDAGADIVNDVSGLEDPDMPFVAAEHDAPLVVMHSLNAPVDPDTSVEYDDVVGDVIEELREPVLRAEQAGLSRSQVVVDPGLGFGKSAGESFELLARLDELAALGCPVMVGHSHKSMFELAGGEAGDCLEETLAATALAVERGADIVRVHDVAENAPAVQVAETLADRDV
jgi:dihydropteroate synthase